MIFLTGYGQMCNNMLQFGHFYAFARHNNLRVIAMRFCYKYPYFNINEKKGYNILTYIFAKYGYKMGFIPKVDFDSASEDQQEKTLLLKSSKFILADGWYFRYYDLFLNYRTELRALFNFNSKTTKTVEAFLAVQAPQRTRIGIHLRRGDYKRWHDGKYYFSDEDYAAIVCNFIRNEKLQEVDLYIVTNDKYFDKSAFEKHSGQEVKLLNGNPGEDLCLLSNCNYIIGPPSTFSLMAAFYNDQDLYWIFDKNKQVGIQDFKKFSYWFKKII